MNLKYSSLTSKSHCQYNHHQNQCCGPYKKANAINNQSQNGIAFVELQDSFHRLAFLGYRLTQ
jgi:hypothetical protein